MKRLRLQRLASPIGEMLIVADDDDALCALYFDDEAKLRRMLSLHHGAHEIETAPVAEPVVGALDAYFAGDLTAIDALSTATGGTSFQREVWTALRSVPAGSTTSYGALAAAVGRPSASRAVGAANGANPVSIVVPCHRIIGSAGALTGYGGGLPRKLWLLEHERAHCKAEGELPF
jgi:methylated-DNA-[protein]-cysteine S-methyltransferase